MVVVFLRARVSDPLELRRLYEEVVERLVAFPVASPCKVHLAKIIWELLTNGRHAATDADTIGSVSFSLEPLSITIRLPGAAFDSVYGAAVQGATGLDTADWLLKLCAWNWSHRYLAGHNEISLVERR